MIISSISFFLAPGGAANRVTFFEYSLYMGYCASDELGPTYNDNYVNGWKYLVFERTSPFTFYETDPTVYFDTPFFYDPANGNLVFEIAWPDGEDEIRTFASATTGISCVNGGFGLPTGDMFSETPHILINGEMALNQSTFAGIKASFR